MFQILLCTVFITTFCLGTPIQPSTQLPDEPSEDIILVPYEVKFVPVEIPVRKLKSNTKNHSGLNRPEDDLLVVPISSLKKTPENDKSKVKSDHDVGEETETNRDVTFDLFKEKFGGDFDKSSEDFVLVPISSLKRFEEEVGSDGHSLVKRQAPGRGFRLNTDSLRDKRRFVLVGYLNNYDHFPTLA